jgi:hypothetical protein
MKSKDFLKENYDHNEYDDEVGSVKTDLITLIRMALELAKDLDDNENLPEWVQGKISNAKGMIVAVGDYMLSQHEQGIRPMVDQEPDGSAVAEDASGGGTSSAGIATTPGVGAGSKVGTLFGGTYKQKRTKKK